MKKTKIKIEKIFRNTVQTKKGPANKFTLMYKNYGFTGWGKGSEYKEGDIVEVEYDENSKYQSDKYTYFNLIRKENKDKDILKEILEIVKKIEAKLNEKTDEKISEKISENENENPEDIREDLPLPEEDIDFGEDIADDIINNA
jgi:hypothetical protein